MLNVFYTVDVEIWCNGWDNIDGNFPAAFQQYIYGKTANGEFCLRFQLKRLKDHGLHGIFFVEPLFATRFGIGPLSELIGLIKEYGHEVQLHLHTEWVSYSRKLLIKDAHIKRQHLCYFSLEEQTALIAAGVQLIEQAGGGIVNAFRCGSFAVNENTLRAVEANGIRYDSSYNATLFGPDSGISPGQLLFEPVIINNIIEYPMTVFDTGRGRLRHVQLGACSALEIEGLLLQAHSLGRKAFVILSHNFELLTPSKTKPDTIVVKRFEKLCSFLDTHRSKFRTSGFKNLEHSVVSEQPSPLSSPLWRTCHRTIEQLIRRVHYR